MWRNEWKILQDAKDEEFVKTHDLDSPENWNSYLRKKIRAYINLWTNSENHGNSNQWLSGTV